MVQKINVQKIKNAKTICVEGVNGTLEILIGKGGWVSVQRRREHETVVATIYSVCDVTVTLLRDGKDPQVIETNYNGKITNPITGLVKLSAKCHQ